MFQFKNIEAQIKIDFVCFKCSHVCLFCIFLSQQTSQASVSSASLYYWKQKREERINEDECELN